MCGEKHEDLPCATLDRVTAHTSQMEFSAH